jgi:hypothetical protein
MEQIFARASGEDRQPDIGWAMAALADCVDELRRLGA